MVVDWNASAVVLNGNGVVEMNCDINLVAVSCKGLVDRVVDDLEDKVMKTHLSS